MVGHSGVEKEKGKVGFLVEREKREREKLRKKKAVSFFFLLSFVP